MKKADLEERETGVALVEFVFEFDEERGQKASIHEELRIVHQDGFGAEAESIQHLERMGRFGGSRIFWGMSRERSLGCLTFDERVDIEFLVLRDEGIALVLEKFEESVDHHRVEL